MIPISKETIEIILDFSSKLNDEQFKADIELVKEKQPKILQLTLILKDELSNKSKFEFIVFGFLIVFRSYEYFYGKLDIISEDDATEIFKKWTDYFKYYRKKLTYSIILNVQSRATRQPELEQFITDYLIERNQSNIIYSQEDAFKIKTQFLILFDILNEQVKKNYPDNKE